MSPALTRARAADLLARHAQDHLLRRIDSLDDPARQRLLGQLAALDLEWLRRALGASHGGVAPESVAPCTDLIRPGGPDHARALALGRQALALGRVAVLVVAGGQGSRLGFDGPKGAFPIGPLSRKTLFQLHAERLVAAGRRHGRAPLLLLMTSPDNHEATCRLLEQRGRFGLEEEDVLVFAQGQVPAVDEEGRLLLEAPDRLAMSPDGNGGAFRAMRDSGALDLMARRGADIVSYIHVDNPLALGCDPLFVGHHLLRSSEFSCKAIERTSAAEKVGCFALVDGGLRVLEYFEIPAGLASAAGPDHGLLFGLANPGTYLWSRSFAERQAGRADLPFHKAHKKIPFLDESGSLVQPARPNGYKLECFAMDTLADAARTALMLCRRDEEFAPVKNAAGEDSPATARELMVRLHARWIERAGGRVESRGALVEISPLFALDEEELASRLPPGFVLDRDLYLGPDGPA